MALDLPDIKKDDWIGYRDEIEKILKDIWVIGETKDTYGLDLNWPNSEQRKTKKTSTPKPKDKNQINSSKDAYEKKIDLFNFLKDLEVESLENSEEQRINCLLQGKFYNEISKQKMKWV